MEFLVETWSWNFNCIAQRVNAIKLIVNLSNERIPDKISVL